MKYEKLDWSIFNFEDTNLGRIDLCYDRKLKASDKDLNLFLENSCKKNENRHAKMGNNILWVGKRSSSNFFRVYLRPGGRDIRFEIEVKKAGVKKFQHYLLRGQFEKFEELLAAHFYEQAVQLFDLEHSYCDWLRANYRQVRKLPIEEVFLNSLSTSYLAEKPLDDLAKVEFFYRLIHLTNYLKSLEKSSKSISMGDRTYQIVEFSMNNFLEFIGKPRDNRYQIKKLVKFLDSLQDIEPILENFSGGGFRRYVAFPYLKIERKKSWWVELSICKELDLYRYPFHLPETFLNYQDNFELKVKFMVLQSFCNISIQEEISTQEFLGRVSISTSKSAKLKRCIVRVLDELRDLKVIEPEFEILTKQDQVKVVTTLTSNLVSRSKSIFYRENINNKFNY